MTGFTKVIRAENMTFSRIYRKVIMRADSVGRLAMNLPSTDHLDDTEFFLQWTDLGLNQPRPSVRIHSKRLLSLPSLTILDLDHIPTGCSIWPAYWYCGPNWPNGGEVDIVEGVNGAERNQMTLHTGEGAKFVMRYTGRYRY